MKKLIISWAIVFLLLTVFITMPVNHLWAEQQSNEEGMEQKKETETMPAQETDDADEVYDEEYDEDDDVDLDGWC